MGTINSSMESVKTAIKCDNSELFHSSFSPEELKPLKIWVCYKLEYVYDQKTGKIQLNEDGTPKTTKIPYDPVSGMPASSDKPHTWHTYETCMSYVKRGIYPGVGFMFGTTGMIGEDIDHCVDENGNLNDFAREKVERLNSYTEYSQSGRGVHILTLGLPGEAFAEKGGGLEIYRSRLRTQEEIRALFLADQKNRQPRYRSEGDVGTIQCGRFFVYTGRHVEGTPNTIEERGDVVQELRAEIRAANAKNGAAPQGGSSQNSGALVLQEDPTQREDVVGAFCRVYTVREAIDNFLTDVYTPAGGNRYTYINGSSAKGLVIYGDLFCFSNHATDPAGKGADGKNHCCSAFEIVRVHKFGNLSAQKSFKAMCRFALEDPAVCAELDRTRAEQAKTDFANFSTSDDWKKTLDRKDDGSILPTELNLLRIFGNDPELQTFRFNRLSGRIEVTGDLPWKRAAGTWSNMDESQLYSYIARNYRVEAGKTHFSHAFNTVAGERGYNPLENYVKGLPAWDGTPRIDTLLVKYFRAEDNKYTRAIMRKTLVGAIARALNPGCQFDCVLTLVGDQGCGKSTFFRILGGEFYSDALSFADTRDKSGAEKLQGRWLMEIGEMRGLRNSDIEAMKQFITTRTDSYRSAYGHFVEDRPRSCIIVGTTNNKEGFLRDVTGNRRFWPVEGKGTSPKYIQENLPKERDQVWAEAKYYYQHGEVQYMETAELEELAQEAQRKAMEKDERAAIVEKYLNTPLPPNWDEMSVYQRQKYFLNLNDFGESEDGNCIKDAYIQRKTVSAVEIWVECFGNSIRDFSTQGRKFGLELRSIMTDVDGWERSDQRMSSVYGRQYGYKRSK